MAPKTRQSRAICFLIAAPKAKSHELMLTSYLISSSMSILCRTNEGDFFGSGELLGPKRDGFVGGSATVDVLDSNERRVSDPIGSDALHNVHLHSDCDLRFAICSYRRRAVRLNSPCRSISSPTR